MINASQEFKNKVNSGAKFVNYADIILKDETVLNLIPEDFALSGFSMSDETTDGKFGVGYAIGKTIDMTIANHTNKFSTYDFYKSIIYMYVAVELEDGRVLKERKGKYYVINPVSPGDTIKLSGVDSMYLLDKPYDSNLAYPTTLQNIISDCCLKCGVNIGFTQFDNYNFVVNEKPEDVTYRDVVSYAAQIAGYNARINNNDAMELIWYDISFMNIDVLDGGSLYDYTESDTYEGGDFTDYSQAVLFDGGNFTDPSPENVIKVSSLSVSTDEIIISGVKVENDDMEILKGTDDYVIHVKDNPLSTGKEDEIATYLYNRLVGYKFRSLSCDMVNNPLFEAYDACYVYDRKGNAYFTLINSVQYKISGFTSISCKAEDPVRNESSYKSEAAEALVKAKRNTEKKLSLYDHAVQNMNMLAANAMGLYRESEKQSDGSEIYYQSNRPITKDESGKCQFEENSVVYKMTGDGFFVSTDGGKVYASGFDSNGNAVVNVLSAIGITFDWAKGGILSLGGDNNIDGDMIVHNADGGIVGRFNKDGLWASNGYFKGTIESKNAIITGGLIDIESSGFTNSKIILRGSSGSVFIRPSGINFSESWNYGTQIDHDKVMVGLMSGTHSELKYDGLRIRGGTYATIDVLSSGISISNTALNMSNGDIETTDTDVLFERGTFKVNISDFKIDSSGTYVIDTSKDVRFSGDVKIGGSSSYSYIGFFGSNGSSKKTVTTIYSTSSASASDCASKINEVINALKAYNLL